MSVSNNLRVLLAMPASLRPLLLNTPSQLRPTCSSRLFTTSAYRASFKFQNVAGLIVPEFKSSPLSEISTEDLFKASSLKTAPGKPIDEELTKLFTKNEAKIAHAGHDFYELKKNTRVPEVCILGRSNVGKSSLVNALANRTTNELAFVSSKAGRTRSINTYGFGPAPLMKDLVGQAAIYKGKEDIPTHAFHLVDMPGYGHASLKDWGKNISLYLQKRNNVKGAIVLIDAEVGPKALDFQLLQLLQSAELRTTIVLTKADKVKGGLETLRKTCTQVWDALVDAERTGERNDWAWDREILVTAVGARDFRVRTSTVTTARLAVARLAGLVDDDRPKPEKNQGWTGKTISFDDLTFASSKATTTTTPSPQTKTPSSPPKSAFDALEQASRDQYGSRPRARATSSTASWGRFLHTTSRAHNRSNTTNSRDRELQDTLADFVKNLRQSAKNKTGPDHMRRARLDLERRPPHIPPTQTTMHAEEKFKRKLQRGYPSHVERTKLIRQERLRKEEAKRLEEERRRLDPDEEWPSEMPVARGKKAKKEKGMNEVLDPNAFHDAFNEVDEFGEQDDEPKKSMKGKAGKKPVKKNAKDDTVFDLEEREEQMEDEEEEEEQNSYRRRSKRSRR
ncbi:hypothetical protein F5Y15DRAFT_376928 [Xylariaceae sp. FL0016]|nr:hypothetical protein F5Y15DRAFT_376928 [Xylariaceae sp. FL0016]